MTTTLGGTATDVMVVPTGSSAAITFNVTVDGTVFTATSAAVGLVKGSSYKYTLTLNSTFMDVSEVSVTPWNAVTKDNLTLEKKTYKDWVKLTYNVTDNSSATQVLSSRSYLNIADVSEMAILEGTVARSTGEPTAVTPAKTYQFSSTGIHIVYVKFTDMTQIPIFALCGCTGLTEVVIPNSVKTIGDNAFSSCTGLTEITVPHSVKVISQFAFSGCTGIETLVLNEGVQSIGYGAFLDCIGLTGELVIPNSVTTVVQYSFKNCSKLSGLTISSNVTIIGAESFFGCVGLTGTLTIPNSVNTIQNGAFEGCTGLTLLIFGSGVQTIGFDAFSGCSGLTGIISQSMTAAVVSEGTFYNIPNFETILSYPDGATGYETWVNIGTLPSSQIGGYD